MATETLEHGTQIVTSGAHTFGTDALLLARFCKIRRSEAVADFGTGCGVIPLVWHDAGHTGRCTAIDISPAAVAQLSEACAAQAISHIVPICADLRTYKDTILYDAIACNPPYFTGGLVAENAVRAAARHELSCTVQDVCSAAATLLKDGGRLYLCNRPERLADVICAMRAAHIEPKRLQFVAQAAGAEPWLFLIEGQKRRAAGMRILPLHCLSGKEEF